jgi:hypothetical protein
MADERPAARPEVPDSGASTAPAGRNAVSIAAVVLAAGVSVSAVGGAAFLLGGGGSDGGGTASPSVATTSAPATTSPEPTGVVPSGSAPPPSTPGDSGPVPSATSETETAPPPGSLDQFLADCERSLENWRPGQVVYPERLAVPLDQSGTYRATIDIRAGAQEQPAPGPGTAAEDIEVQCGVGARLVPLGEGVTVDETDWILREFDSPGTVEWAWSVTAVQLDDAEVRLDLRPAIAAVRGGLVIPADEDSRSPTAAFTSSIEVTGDWTDHLADWFDRDWPVITGAFVLVGAAVAGVLSWLVKQRRALRELRQTAPAPAVGAGGSPPVGSGGSPPVGSGGSPPAGPAPAKAGAKRGRPRPRRQRTRQGPPVDQRPPPDG